MPSGLLAWAVRTPEGTVNIVVTNVTSRAQHVGVQAAGAEGPAGMEVLASPNGSLSTTAGVTLGGQTISPQTGKLTGKPVTSRVNPRNGVYDITVAPASATILTVEGQSPWS